MNVHAAIAHDSTNPGVYSPEAVLPLLESNDPHLVELEIGGLGHVHVPCGRLGAAIGSNTHLKKLAINGFGALEEHHRYEFFVGIANNRSIQTLEFSYSSLVEGAVFSILSPFFNNNDKFESLTFRGNTIPQDFHSLAIVLSRFDSLKELCLYASGSRDLTEVVCALTRHPSMEKLHLFGGRLETNGWAALASMLQKPEARLLELHLMDTREMKDEDASTLAFGLACNSSLQDLILFQQCSLTESGWKTMFYALQNSNCSLVKLCLGYTSINTAAALSLSIALAAHTSIKSLDLSGTSSITIVGWWHLFGLLLSQDCILEDLRLGSTNLNDSIATSLATALKIHNNRSLKRLDLSSNRGITSTGWQTLLPVVLQLPVLESLGLHANTINDEVIISIAIILANNTRLKELDLCNNRLVSPGALAVVLQSPHSALARLDLSSNFHQENYINEETLISLANSLANNDNLEELILLQDADIYTSGIWAEFTRVLCNTSSIMATYNSNHTLEKLTEDISDDTLPEDLRELLRINSENNKREAARLKVIQAHFSGASNLQPIIDMKLNILPHAIAWMGRGGTIDDITDLLYNFVKSVPHLFEQQDTCSYDSSMPPLSSMESSTE